jgi:hypothetical protein
MATDTDTIKLPLTHTHSGPVRLSDPIPLSRDPRMTDISVQYVRLNIV